MSIPKQNKIQVSEIRTRILLVLGSVLFSFLFAETVLMFLVTSERFHGKHPWDHKGIFPQFLIDGVPSPTYDYFIPDIQLPFVLQPGYSKTLVHRATHPVPFQVTLDQSGYRNPESATKEYNTVVVGDSVAFGYGVDDQQTIAAYMNEVLSTYNLAIPGAGPAMYMVMIDRFLQHHTPDRLVVLFYEGNDYFNLSDAYWKELSTCDFPGRSRVFRKDAPIPPVVKIEESFGGRLFGIFSRILSADSHEIAPNEQLNALDQLSKPVILDLENFEQLESRIKKNKERALFYLDQLLKAGCVPEKQKLALQKIAVKIQDNQFSSLPDEMAMVTRHLAGLNCYPVGKDFDDAEAAQNLLTASNVFGGYQFEALPSLKNGYGGHLTKLKLFLENLKSESDFEEYASQISDFLEVFEEQPSTEQVKKGISKLISTMAAKSVERPVPSSCVRDDLFLRYLRGLQEKGIQVTIFDFPNEYRVLHSSFGEESQICNEAKAMKVPCRELYPRVHKQYFNEPGNAVYIDGAHMTAGGNKLVAKWILDDLNISTSN